MLNSIMEVKSVGTFPVILVKVATPPLPPKQSWILSKMDGNECFFGQNIASGSGGDHRMNPKPIKKIVFRSRVLPNNYMKGLFRAVTSDFVLHWNFWAGWLIYHPSFYCLSLSAMPRLIFRHVNFFAFLRWNSTRNAKLTSQNSDENSKNRPLNTNNPSTVCERNKMRPCKNFRRI